MIQLVDRFEEKLIHEPDTGCTLWAGSMCKNGYGRISISGSVPALAHRVSFGLFVGRIPDGFEIDHLCKNRSCVNPDHLEAVTHAENMRRMAESRTHCKRGHEFTDSNTYTRSNGWKSCSTCTNQMRRRRRR